MIIKAFKILARLYKTIALLFGLMTLAGITRAQNYIIIPDTNFVNWLNANGFGACLNGDSLDLNCQQVLAQTYLDISYTKLNDLTGIQAFVNLDSLRCNVDSTLSHIPSLPPRLRIFECRNNVLDSLPPLPDSLFSLSCESNNLSKLPALPDSLRFLACYNNLLDTLPPLPAGLTQLYCSGNLLDSLPSVLPDSLTFLWCFGNKLTSLPALPSALNSLSCSLNQLHSLPALPASLRQLDCYSNSLTSLPALPDSLNSLECHHNQLSSLPALPTVLATLNCEYNNLSSLPALPDSMFQLYIDNNPPLSCLPVFQTVEFLEFFNDPLLTCVPTYGNVVNSDPPLNSLPLCDSSNTTTCTIISGISPVTAADFSIFPNPARDEVTIRVSSGLSNGSFTLTDVAGRELLSTKLASPETMIDVSPFTPGIYLLRIYGVAGASNCVKLVIER